MKPCTECTELLEGQAKQRGMVWSEAPLTMWLRRNLLFQELLARILVLVTEVAKLPLNALVEIECVATTINAKKC